MKEWKLQLILDKELIKSGDPASMACAAIEAGADSIQLRDKISSDRDFTKEAKNLREVTIRSGCAFIINDRVDIALASGADGVHLGQDDIPLRVARKLLGPNKIIGATARNLEQAFAAEASGADYLGVGPIFKTDTKPSLEPIGISIIPEIAKKIRIPVLFIGGINIYNLDKTVKAGCAGIAVASAILNSSDIGVTTKKFIDTLRAAGDFLPART